MRRAVKITACIVICIVNGLGYAANSAVYLEDFASPVYTSVSNNASCAADDGKLLCNWIKGDEDSSCSYHIRFFTMKKHIFFEVDVSVHNPAKGYYYAQIRNYEKDTSLIFARVTGNIIRFRDNSTYTLPPLGYTLTAHIVDGCIYTAVNGTYVNSSTYDKSSYSFENVEFRLSADDSSASRNDEIYIAFDNLKLIIDDDYSGYVFSNTQFNLDYGDGFLESDTLYSADRVKVKRYIANFTKYPLLITGIFTQSNNKKTLSAAVGDTVTIAPGAVGNFETVQAAEGIGKDSQMDLLLWDNLEKIMPYKKGSLYTYKNDIDTAGTIAGKLKLKKGIHPRLITTVAQIAGVKPYIVSDNRYNTVFINARALSNQILTAPVPYYNEGVNMSRAASNVYFRVGLLSTMHRLTNDTRYADRAKAEMLAAAAFPHWDHTANFLSTAQIMMGMAIGYDMLYDYLSEYEKELIAEKIYEFGIAEGLKVHRDNGMGTTWRTSQNNWNLVCNGAMGVAALAIGDIDKYSKECAIAVNYALRHIRGVLDKFSGGGGWFEGVSYYNWMTDYCTSLLSASMNSLGTDYGYPMYENFKRSAYFPLYISNDVYSYNYNDCNPINQPSLDNGMYFASVYNDNLLGHLRIEQLEKYPLELDPPFFKDLLYYKSEFANHPVQSNIELNGTPGKTCSLTFDSGGNFKGESGMPYDAAKSALEVASKELYDSNNGLYNDFYFEGSEIVTLRDSYDGSVFVAANAGENFVNYTTHAHLDMGGFIYHCQGVCWFPDLGLDRNGYLLSNYFTNPYRWYYYRNRAEGHNCVVLEPSEQPDQELLCSGKVESCSFGNKLSYFVMDITPAYVKYVNSFKRAIFLDKTTKAMVVKDKLQLKVATNFYWFAHTEASIELSEDKKSAVLTLSNKKLYAKILSSGDDTFEIMQAASLPSTPNPDLLEENIDAGVSQMKNTDYSKLTIHTTKSGFCEVTVGFIPLYDGEHEPILDVSHIDF